MADYLRSLSIDVYVEEVAPGRPNVIGVVDSGKPGKTLLFEGHTDVVTEGDREAWTYDPFGAEIVGGRMYGRGTNDTKGNLSCLTEEVERRGCTPRPPPLRTALLLFLCGQQC